MIFYDLEKTYNIIPREILNQTLIKKRLSKVYVNVNMEIYVKATLKVSIVWRKGRF